VHLLAFARGGPDPVGTRLGLRTDDGVIDLTDALGSTDVGELLARPELLGRISSLDGASVDATPVELRAPIARPGTIICVGLNYDDHCRDMRCEIEGIGAIENLVVDARPRVDDHAVAAGIGALVAR
jgi:hypothetical protein